jgi:hypothetical protein
MRFHFPQIEMLGNLSREPAKLLARTNHVDLSSAFSDCQKPVGLHHDTALGAPNIRAWLTDRGGKVNAAPPAEFGKFITAKTEKLGGQVRERQEPALVHPNSFVGERSVSTPRRRDAFVRRCRCRD